MNIFAPTVEILPGSVCAHLQRVTRSQSGPIGVYHLQPTTPDAYATYFSGLTGNFGKRYTQAPGLWCAYMINESDAELELHIGLDQTFGRHLAAAYKKIRGPSEYLVPDYQVSALGRTLLHLCGVGK